MAKSYLRYFHHSIRCFLQRLSSFSYC